MVPAGAKRAAHNSWSSRGVFVLAGAGAAIGIGNFWQFPRLVFDNGGGAFLAVYFFCVLLLGLPLLAAQFMIGRLGRDAPDGAFRRVAAQARAHRRWWLVGAMAVLGGFLVFSYLSVIAGWIVAFAVRAATGKLSGLTADAVNSVFTSLELDPEKQLFWYTLYIASVALVSARGLRSGPEPAIRYGVPVVFGLMLALLLYAAASAGFPRALHSAFMPDFAKLSWSGVLAAVAHAFFSLGLGAGALMYGAYLDRDAPIMRLAWYVVALDTVAAVVAAVTEYSLLYSGGVEPAAGLALLFQSLPLAFDHLPWGQLWLTVFFLILMLVAWLSGMALFEPAVVWLAERFRWSRVRAALTCGLFAWLLGSALMLSFNAWAFPFPFLGEAKKLGLFDLVVVVNFLLLPLVGIGSALFAGWVLTPDRARENLRLRSPCAFDAWLWLMRIAIPLAIFGLIFQLSKIYT